MLANPHALIEGIIITCWAIRAKHAFIYIRGEVPQPIRRVRRAVEEARAGVRRYEHPGLGTGSRDRRSRWRRRLHLRRGDGTARLARGTPWPAAPEAAVPPGRRSVRITHGGQQHRDHRVRPVHRGQQVELVPSVRHRSPGLQGVGHLRSRQPTRYLQKPLWGLRCANCSTTPAACATAGPVKFWLPGGSSVPLLLDEHLDLPLTCRAIAEAGSMLGTGTPMLFDDTTSVVKAITRWLEFYKHESCGKCTDAAKAPSGSRGPCRSSKRDAEKPRGRPARRTVQPDHGRSFCALGDAAATPVPGSARSTSAASSGGPDSAAGPVFDPAATMIIPSLGRWMHDHDLRRIPPPRPRSRWSPAPSTVTRSPCRRAP